MKTSILGAGSAILSSLAIFSAQAQQTDSTLTGKPISEVVITATRSEKNAGDVGRSVSVITPEQLKKSIYTNVGELLAQQEGIYVVGAGQNPGMTQSIFMRGANSNQTVILIDGVRITDPSAVNNAFDLSELSLENVERIEVVRGSHSTLYGSAAIGGVVNIFTKQNQQPGFHGNANLKSGTFGKKTSLNEQNLLLNYSAKNGFYVNGQLENLNVKGLDATIDTVSDPTAFKNRDRDDFDRRIFTGKVGFRNNNWDVYAAYKNTGQQTDLDRGAFTDDENYTLDFKRNLTTYGAAYTFNKHFSLRYIGGLSDMRRISLNDSSIINAEGKTNSTFSNDVFKGGNTTNELQANFTFKGISAVAGLGFYTENMTSRNYFFNKSAFGVYEFKANLDSLNLKTDTKTAFAHADLNGILLSEKLKAFNLALGTRFNQHSKFGNYTTLEINPSVNLSENALLYAAYTTGFNAPSLYQLYAPDKDFTSGIQLGNEKLKPETSRSYEIGFKQNLSNKLSIGLAYFYTEVKSRIEYVSLWNGSKPLKDLSFADYNGATYLNLGTQTMRGLEISLNSTVTDKISIGGNLSLVNGKLNYKPASIDAAKTSNNYVQLENGAYLTGKLENLGLVRRPATANLFASYQPFKKLALRTDIRYAGARTDVFYDSNIGIFGALNTLLVSDYTLVDLTAKYQFRRNLDLTIRAENVFGEQYQEIKGFSTRGRGIYGSLRFAF